MITEQNYWLSKRDESKSEHINCANLKKDLAVDAHFTWAMEQNKPSFKTVQ